MSKHLTDIRDEMEERECLAKIAQVQEAWGEDEFALELLAEAVTELEKQAEAGEFGDAGLSGSQIITLGVKYTSDALDKLAEAEAAAEEAEAEAEEEVEPEEEVEDEVEDAELQEKTAENFGVALELGRALSVTGVTVSDIEKLAADGTPEEHEAFGEFLSQLAVELANEEA